MALTTLAACTTPAPAAELRVLVQLVQPASDPVAIARLVTHSAGVEARYLAASSASWHALALQCGRPATCDTALVRLRADRSAFEAVERDERKRIVTP